jgi:hypothetical protein
MGVYGSCKLVYLPLKSVLEILLHCWPEMLAHLLWTGAQ